MKKARPECDFATKSVKKPGYKIERPVAKVGDLQEGDLKEVDVAGTKVLLTLVKGKYNAIGAHCTHYRASLAEGCLCGDSVVCPMHQSRFNVITGDREEPPALDSLPRYDVRVEGDAIFVSIPTRRTPHMVKRDFDDTHTFVILGAGAAGSSCAETLRQEGFKGRIVMITQEKHTAYDRHMLSKGYISGDYEQKKLPWRTQDFYTDYDIDVFLEHNVCHVNPTSKAITFGEGTSLPFDKMLIATGSTPRALEVPGVTLGNIFTLRTMDDANKIIAAAEKATKVVTVGGSFIATEVASSLARRGLPVTVVAPGTIPYARIFGPEIGQWIHQLAVDQGVEFLMGRKVVRLAGNGRVNGVIMDNGEKIPADLVIAGIGGRPATDCLKGLDLNPDGSLTVDKYMCVSEDLYAAGDIARYPDWRTGELIRVEHWRLAAQHGRVAALNMLGRKVEFSGVPFFWTDQFGIHLQYAGHAENWDEIIYQGDISSGKFIAYYVRGNMVLASAGNRQEKEMAALSELMRLDLMPSPEELRADKEFNPIDRLREGSV